MLLCVNNIPAQKTINFQETPELSEDSIQKLILKYQAMGVDQLKDLFSQVKPDQSVEASIIGLPVQWREVSRTPAQVGDTRLWRIGEKVVKLSGSHKYEFIYLANAAPLAISDSNCLLIVSSAMLQITDGNDDALIGAMLHEMSHGIFAVKSVEIKKAFNAAIKEKDWLKADSLRKELALIEIECDLIAGKILHGSDYKVTRFADLQLRLQELEKELTPNRNVQWHPDAVLRKRALLELVANAGKNVAAK